MFCTRCGSEIKEGNKFCTNCGSPTDGPTSNDASIADAPKKGKRTALVVAVIAAVVVIAAAVAAFVLLTSEEAKESTTLSSASSSSSAQEAAGDASSSSSDSSSASSSASSSSSNATQSEGSGEKTGYILSDSSTRLYTEQELASLSDWQLYVARNEIFARHGRGFKNADLAAYFSAQPWYSYVYSPEEFDAMPSPLNDIERANSDLIRAVERARGSAYAA